MVLLQTSQIIGIKSLEGDVMPSQGSVNISDRPSASVRAELTAPGSLTIEIAGRLDSTSTGYVWRETHRELDRTSPRQVVIDASGIEYCDGSGIGLLFQLRRRLQKTGGVLVHGTSLPWKVGLKWYGGTLPARFLKIRHYYPLFRFAVISINQALSVLKRPVGAYCTTLITARRFSIRPILVRLLTAGMVSP